jgi:hypothetical protein
VFNYESANQTFPAGTDYLPNLNPAVLYANGTGWQVALLPYLEQDNLAKQYNVTKLSYDPVNLPMLTTKLSLYQCPSDVGAGTETTNLLAPNRYTGTVLAGSYRGVAGRYSTPSPGTTLFWDYGSYVALLTMEQASKGPLTAVIPQNSLGYFTNPPARLAGITDGTSNTFLIGEYATRTNPGVRAYWGVSWGFFNLGSCGPDPAVRGLPDSLACNNISGGPRCNRAFASLHTGGMNFVNCDGSVRYVTANIDAVLYQSLATIAGGEVVSQ